MWATQEVSERHSTVKQVDHPVFGPLTFEVSTFAVDGRTDLSLLIYNPIEPADVERIAALLRVSPATEAVGTG